MSGGSTKEPGSRAAPPVPALLRRPAMLVRHRMIESLRAAGFVDILPAHLAVFQYPGPEGQRPGVLAARTHASKQAMNHLLHQLETAGYLLREGHPVDRRTRVVRLTDRGRAAIGVLTATSLEIEQSWRRSLGERVYAELQGALFALEAALDENGAG
jgi:DNA-binding MarR family transcriptional regulator